MHVWQERGTDFYSHKKETKTHTHSTKTEFRTVHTSTLIQYSNTNRTVGLTLGARAGVALSPVFASNVHREWPCCLLAAAYPGLTHSIRVQLRGQ